MKALISSHARWGPLSLEPVILSSSAHIKLMFSLTLCLAVALAPSELKAQEAAEESEPQTSGEQASGAQLSAPLGDVSAMNQLSLELGALPAPPSAFEERRFRWLQERGDSAEDEPKETQAKRARASSRRWPRPTQRYPEPPSKSPFASLIKEAQALGGYLPRAAHQLIGQGFPEPLNQRQSERALNLFTPDERTQLKSPLLRYTSVYTPSLAPLARETIYNGVTRTGELYLKSAGRLYQRASLSLPPLSHCLAMERSSAQAQRDRSLFVGDGAWLNPADLDLNCARSACRQAGFSCYLGSFKVEDWLDPGLARGISSIAPSQQLVTLSSSRGLSLLSDEADQLYLSARRSLEGLERLHLLMAVKRSYFSGSWRSLSSAGDTLSALRDIDERLLEHASLALELPNQLARRARALAARLKLSPRSSYHEVIYTLTEWHRGFRLGELTELEGSDSYERLFVNRRGVCRHRSYSFLITARALGVPTRFVVNAAHAFVEVLDPSGAWRRVNLGGEGPFMERPLDPSLKQLAGSVKPEPLRDGLPQPLAYRESAREAAQELSAFYAQPLSEQRALSAPLGSAESGVLQEGSSSARQRERSREQQRGEGELSLEPLSRAELELFMVGSVSTSDQELTEAQRAERQSARRRSIFEDLARPPLTCPKPPRQRARALKEPKLRPPARELSDLMLKVSLRGELKPLRCAWLQVRGHAQLPRGAKRRAALRRSLKGTALQLIVESSSGALTPLEGWGKLDRRGRFSFSARLPMNLPSERLSLKLRLPAQGPWKAQLIPVSPP